MKSYVHKAFGNEFALLFYYSARYMTCSCCFLIFPNDATVSDGSFMEGESKLSVTLIYLRFELKEWDLEAAFSPKRSERIEPEAFPLCVYEWWRKAHERSTTSLIRCQDEETLPLIICAYIPSLSVTQPTTIISRYNFTTIYFYFF